MFLPWPKFQKLQIYPLPIPGVEIKLIFALRAAVSKIRTNFQICHIWAWNISHWQKRQKLLKYSLSTPRGGGVEIELIFVLHTVISEIQTYFQKLPYLGFKLGNWPEFQKLHTYSLSIPGSQKWAYFHSMGSSFRDRGPFSNCHIWAWNLASGQVAHI